MTSSAGIFKEHKLNFLLDEGKLRKIVEVMEKYRDKKEDEPRLKFSVFRSDDSWYETSEVDDVLADDNTQGKKIDNLMLDLIIARENESIAKNSDPLCRVRFRSRMDIKVDFAINDSDRDWCFLLAEDIETQIQRTLRPRRFRWLRENPYIDMSVLLLLISIPTLVLGLLLFARGPSISQDEIAKLTTDEKLSMLLTRSRSDPGTLIIPSIFFSQR